MSGLSGFTLDQTIDMEYRQYAYLLRAISSTSFKLFRTTAITDPSPTWTAVLDNATYTADFPQLQFCRVVARHKCVYVLGFYVKTVGIVHPIVFSSKDFGATWYYADINDDYSWEVNSFTVVPKAGGYAGWLLNFHGGGTNIANFDEYYDGAENFPSHVEYTYLQLPEALPSSGGPTIDISWDSVGDFPSADYDGDGDLPPKIWDVNITSTTPIDGGFHYVGHLNTDVEMAADRSKLLAGWHYAYNARWTPHEVISRNCQIRNLIISGDIYSSELVYPAMDVGKHDYKVVYISSDNRIYMSPDSGQHFEVYYDSLGAYDIECHIAQDEADAEITFIGSDGHLYRTADSIVGGVYGGVEDVVPIKIPIRVASDPVNAYPIWILEHQGYDVFKLRKSVDGVVWTDITVDGSTSLQWARSLREYANSETLQRILVFLKKNKIKYSIDECATAPLDRIGNHPKFSFPTVINLY